MLENARKLVFWGVFPCGSDDKESACNVGDPGLIPGLGRYPGEGESYQLQYSGLENSMDCKVHGEQARGPAGGGRDLPGGSDGKASAYNAGDPGSIPGLGRSPGEGNGNPLQYSCLKIP